MRELSLFSGAGGGLLGTVHLLGWRPVGYVEWDEYCCRVLEQRIKDGLLPRAPIYQMDIREFNRRVAAKYRGVVDVVTGGFPCQPFSCAGLQLAGADERNMWPATAECIRVVGPGYALLENVPGLLAGRYFGDILGHLADCGSVGRYDSIPASACGADIIRRRIFICAKSERERRESVLLRHAGKHAEAIPRWKATPLDTPGNRIKRLEQSSGQPSLLRSLDDVACGVEQLGAVGNGQVPAVVAAAWRLLSPLAD